LTGDTLEDLVKQLAKLPGEAEDVKNHAQSEFDGLSGLNKVKAVAACAEDVLEIKKIPDIVMKTVDGFKRDMKELKEIVDDLRHNQQKYLDNGKKCHEAKITYAVPCYKHIFGEIK
jgi:adenylosuccinate synthase